VKSSSKNVAKRFDFSPVDTMNRHLLSVSKQASLKLDELTASEWTNKTMWERRYAPYFVANFFDWRIGVAVNYPPRETNAVTPVANTEWALRDLFACDDDVWRPFDKAIGELAARMELAVTSGEIALIVVNGVNYVDSAETIAYMRNIGACALPQDGDSSPHSQTAREKIWERYSALRPITKDSAAQIIAEELKRSVRTVREHLKGNSPA
jgi:hypothetical protein